MKIYRFVRHANAPRLPNTRDAERKLGALGANQAIALQRMILAEGPAIKSPVIKVVFHSGVERAWETAEIGFGDVGTWIKPLPILFNAPEGTIENLVLDWASAKYGCDTRAYLKDPIVQLALDRYTNAVAKSLRDGMDLFAAAGDSETQIVCVGHAVWIQLTVLKLLTGRQPVKLPDGRNVELEDFVLGECDQLIVSFDGEGGEEIRYIPLVETDDIRQCKARLAEKTRQPATATV